MFLWSFFLLLTLAMPFAMTWIFHGERCFRFDRETASATQPGVLRHFLKRKSMPLEDIERFELMFFGTAIRAIGPRDGKIGGFLSRKLNALLVEELNRCLAEMKQRGSTRPDAAI